MNISICITTFNEEGSIGKLLDSLLVQSKKPDEIVIVDGGSKDKTVEIINHYQKRSGIIKLLKEKCTRAKGRNLSVELAKNEIIAVTDGGCVARKDWLKNITLPLAKSEIDVSAGFYKMVGETSMQKAMSVFLGITPRRFDVNFLASTRSLAFKKYVWEEVGGFPEEKGNSAEDTYFNYRILNKGFKIARVKNAVVEWGMPGGLKDFEFKIREYATWDGRTKIWLFPGKSLMSHNIKALFILSRYVVGLALLLSAFKFNYVFPILATGIFLYIFWAYRKIYIEFGDSKIALWGPILQVTSDIAVIRGFLRGTFEKA